MSKKFKVQGNWQWICFAVIALFWFLCFSHGDIVATYDHGLAFLDSLFSGHPLDFYTNSGNNAIFGSTAIYFIPLYVIFAVWNFPCWLLIHLFNIEMNSVGCLLWAKGLLVVCVVGSAIVLKKLLTISESKDPNFWSFMYCSSLFVMLPVFAVAQYDIIGVFITLIAILSYSREEKISVKTILIFSLAISLKLFALFPFVFAVLLKEKRILYVIRNVLGGFIVTVITMSPYILNNSYTTISSDFNEGMLGRMLAITIPTGLNVGISLFFIVFFATCIFAYCLKPQSGKEFICNIAWLGTLFYLGFFLFVNLAHPFWIVIMSPYIILLISQNMCQLKLNILLEFIYELSIIFIHSSVFYWIYLNQGSVSFLVLKNMPINNNLLGMDSFGENPFGFSRFLPAAAAAFCVTGGAILILNYLKKPQTEEIDGKDDRIIKKWAYIFRLLCLVGYFALDILITYVV